VNAQGSKEVILDEISSIVDDYLNVKCRSN
jgi:hypothetical protein